MTTKAITAMAPYCTFRFASRSAGDGKNPSTMSAKPEVSIRFCERMS